MPIRDDETPLWADMTGETTAEHVGAMSIKLRSTGHENVRFTVVLAAMADKRNLKPYIVYKGEFVRSQNYERLM